MDDEGERRQELRLIKAFLSITDARKRQRILNLAEQLADDAASDTAALAPADVSKPDGYGDATDRVE
ncbi:hypothetical protein NLM31_38880 [Bradyrhizobium sp. CCGUVB4N]|uniref:hypothetical protein n=1 Tax=Bradyrhizobium sp. CCGUVB4N TaxID=2949631 RepID=UPI0020B42B63|nr:hypothetical protein [Bradyrhizobium sp. CCGUVB4N]MCP3386364.1 hypothetical protein [Bradyrhizobium sp. CCGUVB4N]